MPTFTYTSATITVNSNQIYKTQNNAPAFLMDLTDGTVPSGSNWKVTKVKLNIQYQTYTNGETVRLRKGTSASDARSSSAIATGIKVGANRTLTLSDTESTNRNRWKDLDGKYIAIQGDDSSDNILKSGTTFTIVVTYENTQQKATITGKNKNTVNTGETITFSVDPGIGVASKTYSITCSGHSITTYVYNNNNNTLTVSIPSTFHQYISVYSETATATFTLTSTFPDSTTASDSMTFTIRVADDIVPTLVSFTKLEYPNNTLTGTPILQGVSTIKFQIHASYPTNTMGNLVWSLSDGQTHTESYPSWTCDPFRASGTLTLNVRVHDSRGRYFDYSTTFNVTPYAAPKVLAASAVERCESDGTVKPEEGLYCLVTSQYTWSSVGGANSKTVTLDWKKKSDAYSTNTYSSSSIDPGDAQIIGTNIDAGMEAFQLTNEYKVRITVADAVGNSHSLEFEVDKAEAFMIWDGSQNAIGFGCYPAAPNTVEVHQDWDIMRNGRGAFDNLESIDTSLSDISTALSAIGSYSSATESSGKNLSNSTATTICSVTDLPAGVYIAEGSVRFPANSSGYRSIILTNNSSTGPAGGYNGVSQVTAGSQITVLHTSLVFKLESTGGVYLRAVQTSGASMSSVQGTIHVVRIK